MNKRGLVINCVVATLFSLAHCLDVPDSIPVSIKRRKSGDIYFLNSNQSNQGHGTCSEGGNTTYLVAERCCTSNHHFFNDCSFLLAPMNEYLISTLFIYFMNESSTMLGYTFSSRNVGVQARVCIRQGSTNQPINSSHCQIVSLEVYRGSEQAFSISYDGFSLGNGSTLVINEAELLFDPLDLAGELYRMNLSCSDGVLPESGCLFFKVLGTANITYGKFNCIVPGTLFTDTTKCPTSTISSSEAAPSVTITDDVSIVNNASETPANFDNLFHIEIGSLLFYVVIGVGSVMATTLTLCLMGLCVSLCYKRLCKHKNLRARRKRPANQTGQHNYEDVFDSRTRCAGRTTKTDCRIPEGKETFNMPIYAESGEVCKEKMKCSKGQEPPECRIENPHYARGNMKPREPMEVYSTLVQVGGRKLCDQLDTEVGNDMYTELNKN